MLASLSRREWTLLLLLVSSIFINYIDRSNLSIAAPLLERELALSPTQLGALLASFFWTYALLQLFGLSGWVADRFAVGWVFFAGFLLWSAATAVSGLVGGFTALFAMRLLVGAGESIAYPCYSQVLASEYPQHHRGFANALLDAGSKLGPALGTLLGGLLVARLGWRVFFVALGLASLVWLLPWVRWMPRRPAGAAALAGPGPGVLRILAHRSAWGTFLGHFCGNYFWFFLLTWLPSYLVRERHFSLDEMAGIAGVAYFAIACATIVAGWASDRWIAGGAPVTRVRKSIVVGGLACSTIILPVAIVESRAASVGLLILAAMAFGAYTSNHWAITQTLAGPQAAGRWTGFQNGVGNLAGIAAPWLTGWVVERTGSFHLAFVAAAIVALAGALLWGLGVGRVEPVRWRQP